MTRPGEVSQELLHYINACITTEAHDLAESAGYNGEMGDRGAGRLRKELEFYNAGFNRELPEEWKKYETAFKHSKDPDYAQFLKLKKKFES